LTSKKHAKFQASEVERTEGLPVNEDTSEAG
jgi:hypothetical protein